MKHFFPFLLSFFSLGVFSQTLSPVYLAYIEQYAALAQQQQAEHNIPASITLAQGLLESGAGQSEFAKATNNHFGIKCGSEWTGQTFKHDDETAAECFRVYDEVLQSYEDHSAFLLRPRYASLFELEITDYQGWAHGLKRCGYATDPLYPNKLVKLIEDYNLQQYVSSPKKSFSITHKKKKSCASKLTDQTKTEVKPTEPTPQATSAPDQKPAPSPAPSTPVLTDTITQSEDSMLVGNEHIRHEGAFADVSFGYVEATSEHETYHYNGCKYVVATANDTYASIADEFGKIESELRRYNDAERRPLREGDRVYLFWKKKRAQPADASYRVKRADTAWSISQDKAIQMSTIYSLNGLPEDVDVRINQTLRLR